MAAIDQALSLTDNERAIISSKRTRALIMALAMGAISLLFLLTLVGLILVEFFSLFLITLLLVSFGCGVKAVLSTISFARLNRDLREGQKRFVNAPVEAQDIVVPQGGGSSSAYTFWVKAAGRKIEVSEEQYYQIKKGDLVQAYVAPHSGTVFGITKDAGLGPAYDGQQVAAAAQFTPTKKPLSKTKRLIVAAAAIVVAAVIFIAVAVVAVMNMSEQTYNSLNPFSPKPPHGAFPEQIANYKHDAIYYNDNRSYGYGYEFNSSYKSPKGEKVEYRVTDYGDAQKVAQQVRGKGYLERNGWALQQSDTRTLALTDEGLRAMALIAAGPRLVTVSGQPADVIEFENHLPYNALGLTQPPPRTLEGVPIRVVSMLAEFAKDKTAAATKYDGKTFLFSGIIASPATKGLGDTLLISIQKTGSITASFPASEGDKLARLRVGQYAHLRCRLFAFKDTRNFSFLENCILE